MITNDVLSFLTDCLDLDNQAIQRFFNYSVSVSDELADSKHIQVSSDKRLRAIGVINGILSVCNQDLIAMKIDDETGELIGFVRYGECK